jgi:hypothetical protein
MKKTLALACLAVLAIGTAAQADDDWFNKYDHNHDGHWSYNEFKRAHSDYWRNHRDEKRMSEAELRAQFNNWEAQHKGWVERDQVREFHHWDHH